MKKVKNYFESLFDRFSFKLFGGKSCCPRETTWNGRV